MASFTRKQIAEVLARKTIKSGSFQDNLKDYHQTLVNGSLFAGSTNQSDIILYKDSFLALEGLDSKDFDTISNPASFTILSQSMYDIEKNYYHSNDMLGDLESADLIEPPANVSQFIGFNTSSINIDTEKLNEVLDTNVFELLPTQLNRQDEINEFFATYFKLRSGNTPPFCTDIVTGEITLDNNEVIDGVTECGNVSNYSTWRDENDISYDDDMSGLYITRLNNEANADNKPEGEGGNLPGTAYQTLQWIYEDLQSYLADILNEAPDDVLDDRPEYEHQSEGYLQIRNLNQGIVIKKGEGPNIGLGKTEEVDSATWTTTLDYNIDTWRDGVEIPSLYLDGFTITMWVKFLDKVNGGTLFNFGSPLRGWEPHGFYLETFVLNEEENPNASLYSDNDYERFLRLVVKEPDGSIRDSHVGTLDVDRIPTDDLTTDQYTSSRPIFNYTRVPIDFKEWYFIVATYDPSVDESESTTTLITDQAANTNFWLNNVLPDGYTSPDGTVNSSGGDMSIHKSGLGAKCKVEIISKSDLLRARGYKPLEEE